MTKEQKKLVKDLVQAIEETGSFRVVADYCQPLSGIPVKEWDKLVESEYKRYDKAAMEALR